MSDLSGGLTDPASPIESDAGGNVLAKPASELSLPKPLHNISLASTRDDDLGQNEGAPK